MRWQQCVRCWDGTPHDIPHGTASGYAYHKCRCDECRNAQIEYDREYRARRFPKKYVIKRKGTCARCLNGIPHDIPHGTLAGYKFHKCRCDQCVDAKKTQFCVKCRDGVPHDFNHGTPSAYRYHQCRCDLCVADTHRRGREYYAKHRQDRAASSRRWYEQNREYARTRLREYNAGRPGDAGYRERNREYRNKDSLKRSRKLRETIPGPRNGEPWTPADDAILARDDITLREMCYLTGRGYDAVAGRRYDLRRIRAHRDQERYTPGPNQNLKWSPDEEAIVLRDDITLTEKCELTGRGTEAVAKRRRTLIRNNKKAQRCPTSAVDDAA